MRPLFLVKTEKSVKNMKTKIQGGISFILVLSLLASPSAISMQTWTPGVRSGDYFTYEMYGVYTSNSQNIEIAIPEFEKNTTLWTKIKITEVSGSTIHQVYTLCYSVGGEFSFEFQTDVNPQNQNTFKIADKGVPICATNLKSGDKVPTAELLLNETINRAYYSGLRETNQASWNVSDDWGYIYFDRETGMLVKLQRTHIFVNPNSSNVVEKTDIIKLIDTNRWQIL
jgi:hypothetical protein